MKEKKVDNDFLPHYNKVRRQQILTYNEKKNFNNRRRERFSRNV